MDRPPTPTVVTHCASRKLKTLTSYENGTRITPTLPLAASRGIVPCDRHATGALTSLALPLACAERPARYPCLPDMEEKSTQDFSRIHCVCIIQRPRRVRALHRRRSALRDGRDFLACRLGEPS